MMQGPIDRVRSFLHESLPGMNLPTREKDEYTSIALPLPESADYQLEVWVYKDGEADVTASVANSDDGEFFWHLPLEDHSGTDSEAIADELINVLGQLISHPSRITQRKGLLSWCFTCEILEQQQWREIGGKIACFKWGFRVPNNQRRETTYKSPAIKECSA